MTKVNSITAAYLDTSFYHPVRDPVWGSIMLSDGFKSLVSSPVLQKMNRIRHTAYIVVGIRESYRHRGIGTAFFRQLDEWAAASGIVRLELTVECPNGSAKALYEKNGFRVEGIRPKAMKVNGSLIDEYYMGKIIGEQAE